MTRTLILVSFLLSSLTVLAQEDIKYITLLKEKTSLRFKTFHITSVKDSRPDTSHIGILHMGLTGKKNVQLRFKPNLSAALQDFITTSCIQDTATTPVEMHITQLDITHTRMGLKSHVDVNTAIAFYTNGKKITDFNGGGYSEGPGDQTRAIEELIRKNFEGGMQKFDTWWAEYKEQYYASIGLPTKMSVEAILVHQAEDSNTIVYTNNRPLKLEDFEGPVDDHSKAAASTYSGIRLNTTSQFVDGALKVKVYITPYFDKKRSWCRKNSRNAKTLAHEQRHFDITAVKACDLLHTIQQTTFTSNFVKELERLHRRHEIEWDKLENEYDFETKHGQSAAAQQKWDKKVLEELANRSCYK